MLATLVYLQFSGCKVLNKKTQAKGALQQMSKKMIASACVCQASLGAISEAAAWMQQIMPPSSFMRAAFTEAEWTEQSAAGHHDFDEELEAVWAEALISSTLCAMDIAGVKF